MIQKVVVEWLAVLDFNFTTFCLLVINDGSTDDASAVLAQVEDQYQPRLRVIHQQNVGHGQTCLKGYRWAVEHQIPFVFQIDSDGQCDPKYFKEMWERRNDYDVIYGKRVVREDGWHRVLASWVMRMLLLICFRTHCVDANVPYRLMRTEVLKPILPKIGPDFHLANVALAVLLKRTPGVRHGHVPIRFRRRYAGESKTPFSKFFSRGVQLFFQLRKLLKTTN